MHQHPPPAPHLRVAADLEVTGSALLTHNLGDDWVVVMIGVRPQLEPAAHLPQVTVTAEADDDGLAVAISTDRAGLGTLIRYLTGVEARMAGAA